MSCLNLVCKQPHYLNLLLTASWHGSIKLEDETETTKSNLRWEYLAWKWHWNTKVKFEIGASNLKMKLKHQSQIWGSSIKCEDETEPPWSNFEIGASKSKLRLNIEIEASKLKLRWKHHNQSGETGVMKANA